jgi:hypothetical protein
VVGSRANQIQHEPEAIVTTLWKSSSRHVCGSYSSCFEMILSTVLELHHHEVFAEKTMYIDFSKKNGDNLDIVKKVGSADRVKTT